jgi:transposase InsO family protein
MWATLLWVDWFKNRRLHGSREMTTPKEFEAAYYAQEHLEAGLVLMELSLH